MYHGLTRPDKKEVTNFYSKEQKGRYNYKKRDEDSIYNINYKGVNANLGRHFRGHTSNSFRKVQFYLAETTKKRGVGAILCKFG